MTTESGGVRDGKEHPCDWTFCFHSWQLYILQHPYEGNYMKYIWKLGLQRISQIHSAVNCLQYKQVLMYVFRNKISYSKRHLLHDGTWIPNCVKHSTITNVPVQPLSPMTVKLQNEKLLYSLAIYFCPLRKMHPICQNNSNTTNKTTKAMLLDICSNPW